MEQFATSAWLTDRVKRYYWLGIIFAHLAFFAILLSSLILVFHYNVKNRISVSLPSFKRHFDNQSFREITYLAKNLVGNNISSIEILDHNNRSVFKLGDDKKFDFKIQSIFVTNSSKQTTNGSIVIRYSNVAVIKIGILLFLIFL